ncbi:MAG: flagellar basal-body rod protein FlgC [Myxococcota bacterium]|jgi:flagellar basal-body rod protein FlgC
MSLLKAMDTLGSGLAAQRIRMNLVSSNLANSNTTRTSEGGAYRRKIPVFESVMAEQTNRESVDATLENVQVAEVALDQSVQPQVYDPTHPDADPDTGMLTMPNVNVIEEMVELTQAARSYEANVTAFESLKQMVNKAMELGR